MQWNTATLGRQGPCFVNFSTVPMTQNCHTRSCFQRVCTIPECSEIRQFWVDRGQVFVDFSTVSMTQNCHTRSCVNFLCSMPVCSEIRQLWVDRGQVFVDFSNVSMTQNCHTRSCFHRLWSMPLCSEIQQLWVDRGHVLWILVPFPWPKIVILGLVFNAYVPFPNAVKYVNFGSTGAKFL